jgi:serine/threonine-protein kinase
LDRLIGVGGMAAVYAGVHRNGHAVAIKILHETLSLDPEVERLFRREALLSNKVAHLSVVPVIDDDVAEDGCVFLVMPLLEGETVRARAERLGGKLPANEVGVVAFTVLGALSAAHAQRIVHRDIKPENIFVTHDGEIRVLDFGIARFLETSDPAHATRSGRAVGTPAFMAPEQALGRLREVDARTDLWAVGATMFTLLSGRYVHEGEGAAETLVRAATQAAPRLKDVAPGVPVAVCEVVDRALSFSKDDRWPDVAAMSQALQAAYESTLGVPASELPRIVSPTAEASDDIHAAATQPPNHAQQLALDLAERAASHDPRFPTMVPVVEALAREPRGMPPQRAVPAVRALAGMAVAVVAVIVATVAVASRMHRDSKRSAAQDATQESASATAIPEARAALEAGLQLWNDASSDAARQRFAEAARADGGFSLAHVLYAASTEWVDSAFRAHMVDAQALRGRLTPRHRALLEALAPMTQEPPDFATTTERLTKLTEEFPDDPIAWRSRAIHHLRTRQPRRLLAIQDRLEGASALWLSARARLQLDDVDQARELFGRCAEATPGAVDCLDWLSRLELNEGRCEVAGSVAKRLIAANPESPDGYAYLARAAIGRTHATDAARAVLADRWTHTPSDLRGVIRARDDFFLAVYDGGFDDAFARLAEWERGVAGITDAFHRMYPFVCRIDLELELGQRSAAAADARRFEAASEGWLRSDFVDLPTEVSRGLYLSGDIDRLALAARRSRDESVMQSRGGYFAAAGIQWFETYAQVVADEEDARDAIERLPAERPTIEAVYRDVGVDEEIGRAFLLAGRSRDAVAALQRATGSCNYLKSIHFVRAHGLLGDALHAMGQDADACRAYAFVIEHWGRDSRSTTARAAREKMRALNCVANQGTTVTKR